MAVKGVIKKGEYYDSVTLMLVARDVAKLDGVEDAVVMMGTEQNKSILETSGLLIEEFKDTTDSDLLIAAKAKDELTATSAIEKVEELLKSRRMKSQEASEYLPKSVDGALDVIPDANMVIISVAGKYAGDEAMKALRKGLHVMLFSDNVPLEKEIELKKYARESGLLVMGPDCGTAIINGAPLCFANVVQKGNIGIVAASGTGLQEVSCVISNEGSGISQAIGTGGRDVKKDVGGIMFIEGIRALEEDPETKYIVLISKPPHPEVLERVANLIKTEVKKPVVGIFLGGDPKVVEGAGAIPANNLEEAGLIAASLSKEKSMDDFKNLLMEREKRILQSAGEESQNKTEKQKYVRGLYTGGTLCDEAMLISRTIIGEVYGNSPINPDFKLKDSWKSIENTFVDLGEDEFTVGRPHPMIDFMLRNKKILEEAKDPEVAVILLDVVLGYGSNMQPGDELNPFISEAKELAGKDGRNITFVCSITGTVDDPQDRNKVKKQLEDAGAIVMPSNAAAAKLASYIVKNLGGAR
jgi:FdrA protein